MGDARVGFALTGSFCTLEKALQAMEETAGEYPNMVPILSETTGSTDTRFGRAETFASGRWKSAATGWWTPYERPSPSAPKVCWMC